MTKIADPNPEPLFRGMDPRIRIHTKMLWIRNTAYKIKSHAKNAWHIL